MRFYIWKKMTHRDTKQTEVQGVINFQVCLEKLESIKSFTKGRLLTLKSWHCYIVNTENGLYFEEHVVGKKISTLQ